jgi:hypothetical protein
MSHMHTWTHKIHKTNKTHHDLDLGEASTFPFIILYVISHEGYIQMSFCPMIPNLGILKFPKLGILALWKDITSFANV